MSWGLDCRGSGAPRPGPEMTLFVVIMHLLALVVVLVYFTANPDRVPVEVVHLPDKVRVVMESLGERIYMWVRSVWHWIREASHV